MNNDRWLDIFEGIEKLSEEEKLDGWHFCPDWDGLLIGPDMLMEWGICICNIFDEGDDYENHE